MTSMLNFDQVTIAAMTAALDYAYLKIPQHLDDASIRKSIADAITASARNGHFTLSELSNAGLKVLNEILHPPRRSWLPKVFQ